jgi:hypothetical protein
MGLYGTQLEVNAAPSPVVYPEQEGAKHMKRILLAVIAAAGLGGCYADVAPYAPAYYGQPGYVAPAPVYSTTYGGAYVAPGYYRPGPVYVGGGPVYRPGPVYVAPPAAYRPGVVVRPAPVYRTAGTYYRH